MVSKSSFERQSISEWSCRDVNMNYSGLVKVGSGTYGEVHKAQARDDPTKIVALKKIRDETETQGFPITALREISILQSLNHQNVVKLLEVATAKPVDMNSKKGSTYLVFEYMEHELLGLIESVKFTSGQVKGIMKQLLEGLDYLHSANIIHRDIKSANILMNNKGEVKIADFGLAKKIKAGMNLTPRVVTRWYRAPELLLGSRKYTGQVDIWALGCVFAELLMGRSNALFPAQKTPDQFEMICEKCGSPDDDSWPNHRALPLFAELKNKGSYQRNLTQYMRKTMSNVDEFALELLDSMLVLNPDHRISAKQALQHPYFSTSPLPCPPSEMPKIEKDCHSFTIKAEREKYREMMNLSRQPSKGLMNTELALNLLSEKIAEKNPRAACPKKQPSTRNNTKNLDPQLESKVQLQVMLARTKSQGPEQIEPLHENLSLIKTRSMHRELHREHRDFSSQVLHTIKSDSTLDTDGAPGSRNEDRSMNFQFVLPPLVINPDRNRYGSQSILESAKKKINQQNLAELEKVSKKICKEGSRNGSDTKNLIRDEYISGNEYKQA